MRVYLDKPKEEIMQELRNIIYDYGNGTLNQVALDMQNHIYNEQHMSDEDKFKKMSELIDNARQNLAMNSEDKLIKAFEYLLNEFKSEEELDQILTGE